MVRRGSTNYNYYPYGEPYTTSTPPAGKSGYATYTREPETGLDYAMNRFFQRQWGRFSSADPLESSAKQQVPLSWNRYPYALTDPVNSLDPSGLDTIGFCSGMTSAGMSSTTQAMCAMMYGPRPSMSDLYNSSGLAMGMDGPGSSGAVTGGFSNSPDMAAAELNYVANTVVASYFGSSLEQNPVVTEAVLPSGAVSANIIFDLDAQEQQDIAIASALSPLSSVGNAVGQTWVGGSIYYPVLWGAAGVQYQYGYVGSTACDALSLNFGVGKSYTVGSLTPVTEHGDITSILSGFGVSGSAQSPWVGVQFSASSSGLAVGSANGTPGVSIGFGYGWCRP